MKYQVSFQIGIKKLRINVEADNVGSVPQALLKKVIFYEIKELDEEDDYDDPQIIGDKNIMDQFEKIFGMKMK